MPCAIARAYEGATAGGTGSDQAKAPELPVSLPLVGYSRRAVLQPRGVVAQVLEGSVRNHLM